MHSGTVRVQVHQGAGYFLDLLLAASALYQRENGTNQSKRLESCLHYLQEELPDPNMNLAAIFDHPQAAIRMTERFSAHLFGRFSFDRLMRELSIANPVALLEELIDFWLGESTDPAVAPAQRAGFSDLPGRVQQSLTVLYQQPAAMLTELVQLIRRVDDRLKVVYQTHREALAEVELALEGKTFSWNEAGLQKELEQGELVQRESEQKWLAAVSLLAENCFLYLGDLNGTGLLAVGIESAPRMEQLTCCEPVPEEKDRLPRIFHALSDPLRLKILDLLSEEKCYTGELGRRMNLTVPALLYHLNLLKEAGLIRSCPEGRKMYYMLTEDGFPSLVAQLKRRFPCSPKRKPGTDHPTSF